MNIGPKGDGTMTNNSKKILKDIGKWMKKNGSSIYGVSASPFQKDPKWGTYTRKDQTVYAHVYKWPKKKQIVLKRYKNKKIKKITILGKSKSLKYKVKKNKITVTIPKKAVYKGDTVIAVQYKK